MARYTLYAYVDGSDLNDIADDLAASLAAFVGSGEWRFGEPWVVNQRREDDPTLGPEDLPDWELGLNFDLPEAGGELRVWFSDVKRIVRFLGERHAAYGREFVVGIGDRELGISDDLYFINSSPPDLDDLRRIIGVGDGEKAGA